MKLSFVVTAELARKARLKMDLAEFGRRTEDALAGVLPSVVTGNVKWVRVYPTTAPPERKEGL